MAHLMLLLCLLLLQRPLAARAEVLPFELRDVQLANTTLQAKAAISNTHYLLDTLDPDRRELHARFDCSSSAGEAG